MEERVSGFRVRGSWSDVVAHGDRITDALEEIGVDADALGEWDDWRPKRHERLDAEVSEKTVEHARLEEGAGERAGRAAHEDVERAVEQAIESVEKVTGDGPEDVIEKWEQSFEHAVRAADTTTRKAIRSLETAVYEHVMTRFVPYYFDNELVSANIRRSSRLVDWDAFVFEVSVNDDELRDELGRRLGGANETGEAGR